MLNIGREPFENSREYGCSGKIEILNVIKV